MSESSNHGKAPPKESSTSDHQSSTNTDTSPPMAAPNMMYYPPGTGYPCHGPQPPPYHPYPPPPHGYPPYQQGYNNFPGHAPYYDVPRTYHHTGDGGSSFFRGFIMCSCFIFTGFFVLTLIAALSLHPQFPVFKVVSLSVSNFNTSSILTGDWNISVTAENPNTRLKGYFLDFKVDVVHDNNELAMSLVPDFELEKHEQKQMDVKASSNNVVSFQKWDLDKMSNERQSSSNSIMFGVRVSSLAEFKSTSFATRSTRMLAICEGLKVVFQNNTGNGSLDNGGNPATCQLYM